MTEAQLHRQADVAKLTGLSRQAIYQAVARKVLIPTTKTRKGAPLFNQAAIDAFLATRTVWLECKTHGRIHGVLTQTHGYVCAGCFRLAVTEGGR